MPTEIKLCVTIEPIMQESLSWSHYAKSQYAVCHYAEFHAARLCVLKTGYEPQTTILS
jgi:hypothetical protein